MSVKPEKRIRIVVGLVEYDGKILLLQRKDDEPAWDRKWEFPGGKIEVGEDGQAAVRREIAEETGLAIASAAFVCVHEHTWDLPERRLHVQIDCFRCAAPSSDVRIEDRAAYQAAWVTPEEALGYDSLEANAAILKKIYFPAHA